MRNVLHLNSRTEIRGILVHWEGWERGRGGFEFSALSASPYLGLTGTRKITVAPASSTTLASAWIIFAHCCEIVRFFHGRSQICDVKTLAIWDYPVRKTSSWQTHHESPTYCWSSTVRTLTTHLAPTFTILFVAFKKSHMRVWKLRKWLPAY